MLGCEVAADVFLKAEAYFRRSVRSGNLGLFAAGKFKSVVFRTVIQSLD